MHQITEESRAEQCDIQEHCRKFSFMYRLSVNHVLGQLRDLVEHLVNACLHPYIQYITFSRLSSYKCNLSATLLNKIIRIKTAL